MTGPVVMVSFRRPTCTVMGPVGTDLSTSVTVPEPFTMYAYGLPLPDW
jgi:hypothetical protein